jgi:hypothetical protein
LLGRFIFIDLGDVLRCDGGVTPVEPIDLPAPGKVALENPRLPDVGSTAEDTVGLEMSSADGRRFFYIPGCAALPPDLANRLLGADSSSTAPRTPMTECVPWGLAARPPRAWGI